jgi:hypothetical protein
MTRNPRIPMLPSELPQQRLHEVLRWKRPPQKRRLIQTKSACPN